MVTQAPCELCTMMLAKKLPSGDFDGSHQQCPRCGEFKLTGTAQSCLQGCDADSRVKISGWVYEQNKDHTVPTISRGLLQRISTRSIPSVAERANRLLLEMLRGQNRLNDRFQFTEPRFLAATYSQDRHDVKYLAEMLLDQGLLKEEPPKSGRYQVHLRGHIAADKLTRRTTRSDKGFVAMSFQKNLMPAYDNGFQVGIVNAGYDPVRVDRVEHVNRIDDEIIARIRTASFVVADFTGHRGGVYFEAGFALGLDLPVIWTCQKDDMKGLHFDIRQFNTIDWETHEELASRLQLRIEAAVGKGPKTSLPS